MRISLCRTSWTLRPHRLTTLGKPFLSTVTVETVVLTAVKSQDPEKAAQDFRDRIKNYEKVYQTIDESEKHITYVKITNIGYSFSIVG